ncbi:MAG TPA: type II toxin-antitoxin system prevent-host-death family antitoxin [Pirellulales bacterium]|jgi:prevent-host-death family protein|nr:type II toxin-antitoxin system prevent-host-death family antitoxin [Pirellulales bacterium]
MTTISIQEAQAKLPELIHRMLPGDELLITENNQPIARLVPATAVRPQRKLGTMRGTVLFTAPDFDAPLEDFKEYMQ